MIMGNYREGRISLSIGFFFFKLNKDAIYHEKGKCC